MAPKASKDKEVVAPAAQVEIDRIAAETIVVPIVGTAPLIVHRFDEKMKKQMLDAMQGKKTPKQAKNPDAEYEAARYRFEDGGDGFPVIGFKKATVSAARFYGKNQVTMTGLRQFIFMRGEMGVDGRQLVRIEYDGDAPVMREDVVRVNRGGADLRYRPEYWPWSTTLTVTYVTSQLTRGSVLSLIDAAGLGVGVAEMRPERGEDFGTFRIDTDKEIEVVQGSA